MSTILIIEDEALIAQDLALILEDAGYEDSIIALSADEAVEMAKATPPTLIISDHDLEGQITGPEVVAEICKLHGPIPTIYVTGKPDLCRAVAHEAVLAKPVQEDHLINIVQSTLAS